MQFIPFGRTYKHLQRYNQILSILVRYGFTDVVAILKGKIGRKTTLFQSFFTYDIKEQLTRAEKIRLAFEELGTTFIKLGQILSMRPDIIPEAYIIEFQKFQDQVKPFTSEQVVSIIEKELNNKISNVFLEFNTTSVAAASIGQVHKAITLENRIVAVKVQRPDINKKIFTDLEILHNIADFMERNLNSAIILKPTNIIDELARNLKKELDYNNEARNIQKFRLNAQNDKTVFVPKVYSHLSSSKVLTMDFVEGTKCSNINEIEERGLDRKIIAENGAKLILRQIFEDGFYHADPHAGNMFVIENNVIAPVDYGMMGRIDDELKTEIGRLLIGIIKKDINKIIKAFLNIGMINEETNISGLKIAISDFIDQYYEVPLGNLQIKNIITEMFELVKIFNIKMSSSLVLMLKALVTVEGLGRILYPEFDMVTLTKPYAIRLTLGNYSPGKKLNSLFAVLDDIGDLLKTLPMDFKNIILKLKKGDLNIGFEHKNLKELIVGVDHASNRLSISLIVSALIIGSALIIQAGLGTKIWGYPLVGIIGFLIAGILGFSLVVLILWKKL